MPETSPLRTHGPRQLPLPPHVLWAGVGAALTQQGTSGHKTPSPRTPGGDALLTATSPPYMAAPAPATRTRYLPSDEMAMQRMWDACPMCRSSVPFFPPGTTHSLFPLSTSPAGKAQLSPPGSLPPLRKAPTSLPQSPKRCTCMSLEGPRAKPPPWAATVLLLQGPRRVQAGGTASRGPKGTLAFDEGAVLGSGKDEPVIRRNDQAGDGQLVPPQHADAGWIRRLHL